MVEIAQKHKDQLERIKKNVENFYTYFEDNYKAWHAWKKFLYVTSLGKRERDLLSELNKPQMEFNILEAYVSRQKGEFAKQEPSITVGAGDNGEVDPKVIEAVEGNMRHSEQLSREDNTAYSIYDDMLSGGYSVEKVYTDYSDEMSFEQDIIAKRAFDPTLCGFDPLARESHKGDGEFCFENAPFREKDVKEKWPNINVSNLKYSTSNKKFSWSYKSNREKLIIVCTYSEKKRKKTKIVKLADGRVMTERDYEKFLAKWEFDRNTAQPPALVGTSRMTELTNIIRYRFIENEILEHTDTDYTYLPLIFYDNNSVTLRDELQSESKQYTRPYCYQAKGVQQLKNMSGQTLANEIEMLVQHKWSVPEEGIPDDYKEAYTDPQKAQTLVYKQFYDNNPDVRLDPPRAVARVPTPPEVEAAFRGADQTTQAILGTYDAALGIQKQELSGVAIIEGATQSNAAAMPSIVGYMNGLNQKAKVILDLIPKYYVTPRSIPIIDKEGKRRYQMINDKGQPQMQFSSNALKVKVEAGVNFSVQKTRALQQATLLMKVSPMLAQFFGTTPEGIKFILDNLEMKGVAQLKDGVEKFIAAIDAQKQHQKPDPAMIKIQLEMAKLKQQFEQNQKENQIKVANVAVDNKNADTSRITALAKIGESESVIEMKESSIAAENARTAVEEARKTADMKHRHVKDHLELNHKISREISKENNNPGGSYDVGTNNVSNSE